MMPTMSNVIAIVGLVVLIIVSFSHGLRTRFN